MSLEETAKMVADQIRRQQFIEVYVHHDADGIAAGAILTHAMLRAGIKFRLRVCSEVKVSELSRDVPSLLCDLGAGQNDLPLGTIVVDHHIPQFSGEFHANPRLANVDGDRELSAAGMAYIVAREMGDNRDLAGLVMLGIIGDNQEIAGKNLEIFNDGVANGIIVPDRGLTLAGRDMTEKWLIATRPYLEGISGNDSVVDQIVFSANGENGFKQDVLMSLALLQSARTTSLTGLELLYGDTHHLQREVIEDAHAFTSVVDSCGKAGRGDLAVSLCLRSSTEIDDAWEITRKHHLAIIGALTAIQPQKESESVFECPDVSVTSDVADILVRDRELQSSILVYARSGKDCRISVRASHDVKTDVGTLVRNLASVCGGNGGGHTTRAGAVIPCDNIGTFVKGWQEGLAA